MTLREPPIYMVIEAIVILYLGFLNLFPVMTPAKVQEPFHTVLDAGGADTFSCEDANGSIKVRGWPNATIQLDAVKEAPDRDALKEIAIRTSRDGHSIKVVTDFGTPNTANRAVHYDISLPAAIREVSLNSANADIQVDHISGQITIRVSNGHIRIRQTKGGADVQAINGSIQLALDQTQKDLSSQLRLTNGQVQLVVPENSDLHIDAAAETGSITSELPISVEEQGPHVLKGKLGRGGQSIVLRVTNGSIALLKLR